MGSSRARLWRRKSWQTLNIHWQDFGRTSEHPQAVREEPPGYMVRTDPWSTGLSSQARSNSWGNSLWNARLLVVAVRDSLTVQRRAGRGVTRLADKPTYIRGGSSRQRLLASQKFPPCCRCRSRRLCHRHSLCYLMAHLCQVRRRKPLQHCRATHPTSSRTTVCRAP